MFSTPVLFLVFNRPHTTARVFETIRQVKPRYLYIAADGPRRHRPDDAVKCRLVREIVDQVDWNCEVKTLFREANLGCKYAVSSAIDWFFEQVEQGIILEDDCLPDHSFFKYCEELLSYYRCDHRVMHISGSNGIYKKSKALKESYYFSIYSFIWGWATWRRAWQKYRVVVTKQDLALQSSLIKKTTHKKEIFSYWMRCFEEISNVDTWDTQWMFSCWINNGLSIVPAKNLVSNIGFSPDALHTRQKDSPLADLPLQEIINIIHPVGRSIEKNLKMDLEAYKVVFNPPPSILNSIRNKAYQYIPPLLYTFLKKYKDKLMREI